MQKDIVIKWRLPQSTEKVWKCITTPELIEQWLMKNTFQPVVGHKFNFYTKPIPKMGFDGIVYCEVLEVVPCKKLVYTWKGGSSPENLTLDTILTWTLTPREDGTDLLLEHKGFKGFKNYITSLFMGSGWRKHISRRLMSILNEMK
ncbi:SRPBCC domain-containing protein [Mucilaginibacter sp. L3T2-6]|uniref:SRPBCC family protein n=1 Tax=Mucilaginibacter sp. L3T2-6 TaxID=3062491 RepID=UPI002676CB8D|nr:SRPBCC domain-containing protein [Mucilaginibacter sp. L3T2-6]MDO3641666.1 SRPBCC domain-containing protein [Mucilaginibacter sp. L3T2-6]MDV6214160.1 SRPBCC domain-containing protein [Mucilaginibacter sp. L3T2-6]